MKLSEVSKILEQPNAAGIYDVYIPSLKKKMSYKYLTVGQQKTLSKIALDDPENYYVALTGLIQQLLVDRTALTMKDLNELDRVYILSQLMTRNLFKIPELTTECECGFKYDMKLDFSEAVKHIEKYNAKTYTETIKVGEHNFTFTVGLPSLESNIMMIAVIKELKEKIDNLKPEDIEKEDYTKQLEFYLSIGDLLFIKNMEIDGDKIEDIGDFSYETLVLLSNIIPSMALQQLHELVEIKFKDVCDYLMIDVTCPKCKTITKKGWKVDDFFLF